LARTASGGRCLNVHSVRVVIRPFEPGDAAEASTLVAQLGYPTTPDSLIARAATMQTRALSEAYVAVADETRVVALSTLHVVPLLTSDEPIAYLTSMVVREDLRGRGIGRLLVQRMAERAAAHGCSRLTLSTHLRRPDAHAFYERVGFEHTGRRYVLQLHAPR
jgi:aminoglycoside 6'-N-acetyltransferase I